MDFINKNNLSKNNNWKKPKCVLNIRGVAIRNFLSTVPQDD